MAFDSRSHREASKQINGRLVKESKCLVPVRMWRWRCYEMAVATCIAWIEETQDSGMICTQRVIPLT